MRARLAAEVGTIFKQSPERVALVYPSPYATGMSSLGFQQIYRTINETEQRSCERAFLPDDGDALRGALRTYETSSPVGDFEVIGISVAYELELAGVVQTLRLSGLSPLASERPRDAPFVLGGGPLTFSNPLPLAPFVDAIMIGEADETVHHALDVIFSSDTRAAASERLAAEVPSCFVPSIHGIELPDVAKCSDALLPAFAQIRTPNTELRDMFLIEAERGCHRQCQYCVMRRSTNGGMRIVDMDRILGLVPDDAPRVGLVGAAVSDHPKIAQIIEALAGRGKGVGVSSLRPDRLSERLVSALRRGGYKTLTTASDGASQRLRDRLQRKARERHLEKAARLARAHSMTRMKLYMMVGVPDECDEDIDELIGLSTELSKIIPLSLGIAPFIAKRNTPLDGEGFAGIKTVEQRLKRLRKGLRGRVDLRATSARWAWVEYVLAQGGPAEGLAVLEAVDRGGRFRDYEAAFAELAPGRSRRALRVVD